MNCPQCDSSRSAVMESRPFPDFIRRRRLCQACGHRYSSYEIVATTRAGRPRKNEPPPWVRSLMDFALKKYYQHTGDGG